MKYYLNLTLLLLFVISCQNNNQKSTSSSLTTNNVKNKKYINVGVFDKNGDSPYCITDAIEALKIDSLIRPRIISAADIISGRTKDLDVYLFPGGGGRSETGSLGELGQQKIIELVTNQGKGIIGICAGAYILTKTPNYPSLGLNGAEAIDLEHDHRGHGIIKFSLTEKGKKIFPELVNNEIYYSQYYEGPVLIPEKNTATPYTELATMLSDVHLIEGTPANMTNNRPFIITTKVGKGQSASIVGHPESTQGMRWIIPRLVRVVSNNKLVSYKNNVVRPNINNKEILFTPELLKIQEKAAYSDLIGSKEEKLEGLQKIVDMRAWSAKKWIPPMVRDNNFEVRLLAAKLIVELERTDAIPDLEAAVYNETNIHQKQLLQEQLDLLRSIYGSNIL